MTISSAATGVGSITGGTCGPTGPTDADGKCTVIVNSATPGTTTVNASGTVTVGGVAIGVATDGYGAHDISEREDVRRRADHDQPERDEPGRRPAHVHRLGREERRLGLDARQPASRSSRPTTGVGTITGGTCGPTGPTDADGKCTIIVNSSVPGTRR